MEQISQTIGFALGLVLVGWVAVGGLVAAVRSMFRTVRRRRSYRRSQEEFQRRVAATAQAARAAHSIGEWEGWRPLRVVAIVDEAVDVKSFYLSPVDDRPLAPFAPGQYLTFRLHPSGGGPPVVRCYSLSDFPHEDYYRTTIKLIRPPSTRHPAEPVAGCPRRDLPIGVGSGYFHEQVRVGDVFEARAPAGTFLLDTLSSEPVVLVGAGIGITPLVSMLGAAIHSGRRRTVYALFGFRNSREHPFKEHLETLGREHRNLQLHVSYSAPLDRDVLYRDFNHHGRVAIDRLREVLPSNNFHFYLCGPGAMMETLVADLIEWGVPESYVHFEAFGPASVKRVGKPHATKPCEVRFERSKRTVKWDGSVDTLLELGEANGIRMPSGCRAGSCGECLTALRSGQVELLKSTGVTVPPGQCLTCISVPTGPVELGA